MRLQRGNWLGRGSIWSVALVLASTVVTTAQAQPSFGPDPFRPYINQYDPYVYPMGPASPMGGGAEMWVRSGYRGANQFQNYLSEISTPGRNSTDRAGIGMPYYRSSVDGSWGGGGRRDYQPNAGSTASFEQTQRQVSDKYFAYFAERDPKKRAALLKEYRQARRSAERALDSGAPSPSQVLESASGARRGSEATRRSTSPAEDQPSSTSRFGQPTGSDRGRGVSSRLAPPPIPSVGPSRIGGRSRSNPSSVLDRAGGMDDRNTRTPGSTSRRRGRTSRPSSSPPPEIP